jgi:hypothetical protein
MKIKKRWIDGIKQEAAKTNIQMPWERGLRRQAMITRRQIAEQPLRRVANA